MTQKGFSLEMPSGDTFAVTEQATVALQGEKQFFIDGLQQFTAFYEKFISDGGGGSDMQSVAVGIGAGTKRFQITFTQYEGSTDSWGDSSSGDTARSKMDEFDQALSSEVVNSKTPATLATGEYSSSGKFSTKEVAPENWDFSLDPGEESSSFSGTLSLIEVIKLDQTIDGSRQDPNN